MVQNVPSDIWLLLEEEAARINNPAFIDLDPVQFPRRFALQQDIEIAALLCATIAWGNRSMICRDCEKLLSIMEGQPYHFVVERGFDDIGEANIHRTFFTHNLRHYLNGLFQIYSKFGTLEEFARRSNVAQSEFPAWRLVEAMNAVLCEANGGCTDSRCLPLNLESTALKRINMALRWLVRDDGIVDMGIWKVIGPDQLFIPLDVHVGNTARELGLLSRKANDKRSVLDLTALLKTRRPEDPVWFDFALFGIGISAKSK